MNKTRKFFSVLLMLVMLLSIAVPAFAAEETGSITVDNPREGQTYTAHKIFDVTYDEGKNNYAYSISTDSDWYPAVAAYATITLDQAPGKTDTYVAAFDETFSAPEFASYLKGCSEGKTGTALTLSEGKATAAGLPLGYYFVTSANGALCNLTTTNPDTVIYDKNDVPFEKTDNADSVEVGQTVNYTITGKVPDTTGFASYVYEIRDIMSDGLTFNKDIRVSVDGTLLTEDYTVDYEAEDAPNGFVLNIGVRNLQNLVGKKIEVTYSALVNEKAVAVISRNTATLTYSNDPTDGAKTTTTTPDTETVFSTKIVIDKYEAGNKEKKLAGAEFVLLNEAGEFYKYTAATGDTPALVEWVVSQEDATVITTDGVGAASFGGLKNGTYTLREIKAPRGYNLLKNDVSININGDDTDETLLTVTAEIENNTGSILPGTGGIGTTIFYISGSVLLIGAAVLLIVKKRMSMSTAKKASSK